MVSTCSFRYDYQPFMRAACVQSTMCFLGHDMGQCVLTILLVKQNGYQNIIFMHAFRTIIRFTRHALSTFPQKLYFNYSQFATHGIPLKEQHRSHYNQLYNGCSCYEVNGNVRRAEVRAHCAEKQYLPMFSAVDRPPKPAIC